jgi:SAM-dependent methyltransferase
MHLFASLKGIFKATLLIGPISAHIINMVRRYRFPGSQQYWEERYARGGHSGFGSYGEQAAFKSEIINSFVRLNKINSVIEFGCGDGNQLSLASYPNYIGVDVSPTAIGLCQERFKDDKHKRFILFEQGNFQMSSQSLKSELALSLDVIFHLVEDSVFETHMNDLFSAAERFVIIYSSDTDADQDPSPPHVKHRRVSQFVEMNFRDWVLIRQIENQHPFIDDDRTGSWSKFLIYEKKNA